MNLGNMLSIFRSKRYFRLLENQRRLVHYLNCIKQISDMELAKGLDMASEIKSSSLEYEEKHTDFWNAFNKPILVNEKIAEKIQDYWIEKITAATEAKPEQMQLYVAGMSIWSYSLIASAYPELRQQGLALWKELQRGFKYCNKFDPQKDVPEVF